MIVEHSGPFLGKAFLPTLIMVMVWVNASEIFRYFVFIMPMMRDTFPYVQDIAPMNLSVFTLWGVWDTILVFVITGFSWLYLKSFGSTVHNAIIAATCVWFAVFVIFWLGMWNLNLATVPMLVIAWPLSWVEMVLAALIVRWGVTR